jgi:hypothetical protein
MWDCARESAGSFGRISRTSSFTVQLAARTARTMKILITGGARFIGSLLARALLRREQFLGRTPDEIVLADFARPAPDL